MISVDRCRWQLIQDIAGWAEYNASVVSSGQKVVAWSSAKQVDSCMLCSHMSGKQSLTWWAF